MTLVFKMPYYEILCLFKSVGFRKRKKKKPSKFIVALNDKKYFAVLKAMGDKI